MSEENEVISEDEFFQRMNELDGSPVAVDVNKLLGALAPALEEAMKPKPWYKSLKFKLIMLTVGLVAFGAALGSSITWVIMR